MDAGARRSSTGPATRAATGRAWYTPTAHGGSAAAGAAPAGAGGWLAAVSGTCPAADRRQANQRHGYGDQ